MGFLTDNFLSRFFVDVIYLFHGFTGDYVLAMLLFVLLVKVLLLPLDVKSKRSTLKTQMVQPKINAIRERYKNDPQKQSIALRELYKKEDIKMTAGCLPMLLQLPILFAMFGAIRFFPTPSPLSWWWDWPTAKAFCPLFPMDSKHLAARYRPFSRYAQSGGVQYGGIHRGQDGSHHPAKRPGCAALQRGQPICGSYFRPDGYHPFWAICFPPPIKPFPRIWSKTASALNYQTVITPVLEAHAGFNNGYYVLPLLTFVTQWILARMQTKQQAMTTGSVSGSNFMMELLMPLMMAWFAMTTGALFALYWTVGNLWSLGQSLVLNKVLTKSLNEAAAPAKK